MATKVLCDCKRTKCGYEVNGHNAGREPVIIRSAGGFRFEIRCVGGPDGGDVDLRPNCVHAMVTEGEIVRDAGKEERRDAPGGNPAGQGPSGPAE